MVVSSVFSLASGSFTVTYWVKYEAQYNRRMLLDSEYRFDIIPMSSYHDVGYACYLNWGNTMTFISGEGERRLERSNFKSTTRAFLLI